MIVKRDCGFVVCIFLDLAPQFTLFETCVLFWSFSHILEWFLYVSFFANTYYYENRVSKLAIRSNSRSIITNEPVPSGQQLSSWI